MLTPLLIIGLGGSGGKTIRSMKQALNRKLESVRYEGGLPAAWQFLQIDTTYDGVDFPAPMLPSDEFHCVVPNGSGFYDVLADITSKGTVPDQQKMLAGWGVRYSAISIQDGAGQIRASGRQVGVAHSKDTLGAIKNSISKMQAGTAIAELREVARALGGEVSRNDTPKVFIISSLAGGSGAGMFMDVAELLKRATPDNWAQEAISFLYTAEVFSSIGLAGKDVSKNSLGAMNELIASKWVGISDRSNHLYSKLGLANGNSVGKREYGCKGNFLIGARNDENIDIRVGVDGEGMNEVFLTVGEALAGAISNDEISEFLYKKAMVNVTSVPSAVDISGLAPEADNVDNPTYAAAGIGFAQLTLGADRIKDYVADAMAKVQIEKLLWPEQTSALLKNGVSLRDLIDERSAQTWPNFLIDSGLDERGSQNQIIDELLPEQLQERNKKFAAGLIKKSVSSEPKPLARFASAVWSEWETDSGEFLKSLKNEMGTNAEKWVPSIQNRLRELIANEIMMNGYAVVSNLVARLETELVDYVIPELKREHKEFAQAVEGFDQKVFSTKLNEIAAGIAGVGTQNGPVLEKLAAFLTKVLDYQVNSYVNDLSNSLVEDLLSSLIKPLQRQLTDARDILKSVPRDELRGDGTKNPYKTFPDWGTGVVPNKYKNRTIERILIDSAEYESTYDFYASRDSNGAPAFQQSVSSALLGKKMNPMAGDVNEQTLITVISPWITSVRDAQGTIGANASKSDWKFNTNLDELSENNRRWLKNKDSSFGKFTDMSIREYVSAAGESILIRAGRESKFAAEYEAMIKIAAPLVLLNQRAAEHVRSTDGGSALQTMWESNKIPFAMDSNVGKLCVPILEGRGHSSGAPGFAAKWFNAGSNVKDMFAASSHIASLPAWTFASLTDPILQQVAQSKNLVQNWNQFWDGRRSRPLTEAIPFEAEMRRSMITGWFISRLFGLGIVEKKQVGRTAKIWNPTLQVPGWSTFPSPLIPTKQPDTSKDSWVLPQLLVSAGIALSELGNSGSLDFIYGYRLLKFLGREVTTSFPNRDHWDGRGEGDMLPTGIPAQCLYLREWIESGTTPNDSLKLNKKLQEKLLEGGDRESALIATVEVWRTEYAEIWNGGDATAWNLLSETWELQEDIDLALSDIASYVAKLGKDEGLGTSD